MAHRRSLTAIVTVLAAVLFYGCGQNKSASTNNQEGSVENAKPKSSILNKFEINLGNLSTPEKTFGSMIKASRGKDYDVFKKCFEHDYFNGNESLFKEEAQPITIDSYRIGLPMPLSSGSEEKKPTIMNSPSGFNLKLQMAPVYARIIVTEDGKDYMQGATFRLFKVSKECLDAAAELGNKYILLKYNKVGDWVIYDETESVDKWEYSAELINEKSAKSVSIHDLVEGRDLSGLERLIKTNPKLVNARDNGGKTPLHWAVLYTREEMVKMLIARGADVNVGIEGIGYTPLLLATEHGNSNVTKFLLSVGSNVNVKNEEGCTPLHNAAKKCDVDDVILLLNSGAVVNAIDKKGYTPLHYAAGNDYTLNSLDAAKALLAKGANVNARANDGKTPLDLSKNNVTIRGMSALLEEYNKE
ncbi:ankyrin repeat domain-containing protein [Candidatus Woesearchaeota archaeon]|nr:ankyrin repeat domain-containing protein [Candidatus Woesearchaeota archaeon]